MWTRPDKVFSSRMMKVSLSGFLAMISSAISSIQNMGAVYIEGRVCVNIQKSLAGLKFGSNCLT